MLNATGLNYIRENRIINSFTIQLKNSFDARQIANKTNWPKILILHLATLKKHVKIQIDKLYPWN